MHDLRIVQLLPTISYGDAVGNDTLAIDRLLKKLGCRTGIYAENIDGRLPEHTAKPFSEFPELKSTDIIIYHASTGTPLNYQLPALTGRKVMIYHNVTPPHFFHGYSSVAEGLTMEGLQGISQLSEYIDYCIAVSSINKGNLIQMGYQCPIDVCPILIPFSDYEKKPDTEVMQRYGSDGITNILFVGRIAPNKKQEDIIRAFYCYRKYYNQQSRLILCGSWGGMERYHQRLVSYVEKLGISQDVVFTGHVRFEEILAYYRVADLLLCMSEHEGFCVPLVEAMYFNVPILARAAAAVPETLDGSGVLLSDADPLQAAKEMDHMINDEEYRKRLLNSQNDRLAYFSYDRVERKLKELLTAFIEGESS